MGSREKKKIIFPDRELPGQVLADIIQWDIKNWSQAVYFWKNNSKQLSSRENLVALDLGARNGGISLFLASQGIKTICSDLYNPEEVAKPLHQRYGVEKMIDYRPIDILNTGLTENSFKIVTFKSVLGDLSTYAKQVQAIQEIHRVLKPDGELWFAENLKASFVHQYFRKHFIRWGEEWRYLERDELIDIFQKAGFKEIRYRCYGFWGVLGRTEMQRRLLSYLDSGMNVLLPDRVKYIMFGIAVK